MNMKNTILQYLFILLSQLLLIQCSFAQQQPPNRWQVQSNTAIQWEVASFQNLPHKDNIEMAGKRVAGIVSYEVDTSGILHLERQVLFPQLHPFIKSTEPDWFIYRAYLKQTHQDDILPKLYIGDKRFVPGPLKNLQIKGLLHFEHQVSNLGLTLNRKLFPSPSQRSFIEQWTLTNTTDSLLTIKSINTFSKNQEMGASGIFTTIVQSNAPTTFELAASESISFSIKIMATREGEEIPTQSAEMALAERVTFLNKMSSSLILETPNPTLNTLFEFSKIRASESIFESKMGLIHSPGGGRYYVGIWANDQAEYVNPFFPFLGYDEGNESAMNTFLAFAKEINPQFEKIRYAFEIEGTVPPFLLDRGDAAMIAYGASQYVLALGNRKVANQLWPLISWCLEYNHRQLNEEGVVKSESDEMEDRIPTGTANLSTSALYYGALDLAVDLTHALGMPKATSALYQKKAEQLKESIEKYFGANIEGLVTYKYYKEHQYLRHWICLPLVVGIHDRKEATTHALFDRLWSDNGVHVEKNSDNEDIAKIFWDRGTLYALRGTFLAGATDLSLEKLEQFSQERLLGNRVPYVVEAYPEGDMAHLSAESGLYCRVFTEGLFGIKATGFSSFSCLPKLPTGWDHMALRKVKAFGQDFDLEIRRKNGMTNIKVINNKNGRVIFDEDSTLEKALSIQFK